MASFTRRQVVRGTGLVFGGLTASGTVLAESSDRFLVDTRNVSAKGALERAGLEVIHDLSQINLAVVHGRHSQVKKVTRDFAPDIAFEAQRPVRHQATAEDATDEEYWSFQWDKQVQNIPAVHEITRGEGTRVAVLDTGVDPLHPDLKHAVNTGLSKNFTPDGGDFWDIDYHGTHVSGIIAASDNHNDGGIVGTAPGTDLLALRVFRWDDYDNDGEIELVAFHGDTIAAMVYAASHGCDAINMSLGSYSQLRDARGYYARVWNRVTTYVNRQGTLAIASAGNSSINLDRDKDGIHSPSGTAQVMSVSATGPIGYLYDAGDAEQPEWGPAFYTNYGMSGVDIGAPGGNLLIPPPDFEDVDFLTWLTDLVLSTVPRGSPAADIGDYRWDGGTSMAAPQVTGAAALIASLDTGPRRSQAGRVESTLTQTAAIPEDYDRAYYGSGFIDPLAAVNAVK